MVIRQTVIVSIFTAAALGAAIGAQTVKPGAAVDPSTRNEDVLVVRELSGEAQSPSGTITAAAGVEIRRRIQSLATLAVVTPSGTGSRLYTAERSSKENALVTVEASLDASRVLGLKAELGRLFIESDLKGSERAAVLVHGAWRSYFGSSPDVIGKTGWLLVKGQQEPVRIVGVLPLGALQGVPEIDPKAEALILSKNALDTATPGERWYAPVLRLNRSVAAKDVQAVLDTIAQRLATARPGGERLTFRLETLRSPRSQ